METGKPVGKLLQSSRGTIMPAETRLAEMEVVRSGQIQGVYWGWGQLDLLTDWT